MYRRNEQVSYGWRGRGHGYCRWDDGWSGGPRVMGYTRGPWGGGHGPLLGWRTPQMGPIFGGMLMSEDKAPQHILSGLKGCG